MLKGSLFAGLAFASAGTTLAHALQYPIGARTRTPHGLGTRLLLPYSVAFNAPAVLARTATLARTLGAGGDARAAVGAVHELATAVGVPPSLAAIGVGADELPEIAAEAISITRLVENNARPFTYADALSVLEQAMVGRPQALLDAEALS